MRHCYCLHLLTLLLTNTFLSLVNCCHEILSDVKLNVFYHMKIAVHISGFGPVMQLEAITAQDSDLGAN